MTRDGETGRGRTLFERLRDLALPTGDYAVFGSGPLIVRGIVPAAGDLDVLCRAAAWQRVQDIGKPRYLPVYGVTVVELDDGAITFGTEWGIGDFDVDELIENAEIIDDLPFVAVEHVVAYKRLRDTDKDRQHLEALAQANASSSVISKI